MELEKDSIIEQEINVFSLITRKFENQLLYVYVQYCMHFFPLPEQCLHVYMSLFPQILLTCASATVEFSSNILVRPEEK